MSVNVNAEARMSATHWWLLGGLTFAWGFNWTAIKIALDDFTPWIFRALCLALGALVLFGIALANREDLRVPRGMWGRLWLHSILNVTCWNMLIAYGLMMIPSGRAATLAFTMPVWSIPLSVWLLGEPFTRRKLVALLMGTLAMVLLVSEELGSLGRAPLGALLALTASLTWAFGTVLQKRLPTGQSTLAYSGWTMLLGGVPVFAGVLAFESDAWHVVGAPALGALAYNVLIAFAFAYWAWFRLAQAVSVAVSSISILSVPVVGVVSGIWLLGERPGWHELLALLLVVASVLVINLPTRRARQD